MRDVGPCQAHDPRIAGEVTSGQLWQLPVVVRRQVIADLTELLVDDRVVVDEPFGRRGDRALVLDRAGEGAVGLEQDPAVVCDAGMHGSPLAGRVGDCLGGGKRPRVLLEPLDAEQLVEDRLVELGVRARRPPIGRVPEGPLQGHNLLPARPGIAGASAGECDTQYRLPGQVGLDRSASTGGDPRIRPSWRSRTPRRVTRVRSRTLGVMTTRHPRGTAAAMLSAGDARCRRAPRPSPGSRTSG